MLQKSDKINAYTLEKYLGKGSYGEVWLAKKSIELSDDGILVALKFLNYQSNKNKTQENFIKEVRREVATWIKASGHKNIVSVQDGFAFRDDTFVIVSDFAEGGSLDDWLDREGGKSPSLEKTVEIMSEILDGLTHLHSQQPDKIIHRDLKPDNILFKSGVPCITDFGVSRMSQTITQSMAQLAATSAGTPLYMSPESFNNQPASRSMDIWSAGVILYQMLSGKFPFYADNPISLALEVISDKSPNPLSADIPREFQTIVAKALEKVVSRRFQTAEEMKTDLKEAFDAWKIGEKQTIKVERNKVESIDKTIPIKIQPTEDWRDFIESQKIEKNSQEKTQPQILRPDYIQFNQPIETKKSYNTKLVFGALGLILVFIAILIGLIYWNYSGNSIIPNDKDRAKNLNTNTYTNNRNTATQVNKQTVLTTPSEIERKLTEISLPDGTKLQAYPGGIEDQLIKFIQSDEYKNGTNDTLKDKWFNFDDLNFKTGSTELSDNSKRQLDNLVAILKAFPDVKIKIGGYTDKTGDDAANKKLSDGRAKAVKAALEKAGVGAQVPEAEGYGEEFAKVDENASDEERKADRKTAVRLIK